MIVDVGSKFTMQGCKQFEPRLFYQISLDELVPKTHLVRRLAEVLDLSWIRSATTTQYSETARPSVDPEASLYHRRGQGSKLAYKTPFLAEADHGVITAVASSSAAVDDTTVGPELLEHHEHRCGTPRRAVGDHLYGSQDCLGYLQDKTTRTGPGSAAWVVEYAYSRFTDGHGAECEKVVTDRPSR